MERLVTQEKDLGVIERGLTELNTVASRLVLGTSVSWALAQPVAEMLVLMADHPNPVKVVNAMKRRNKILRENPEAAQQLSYLADAPLGLDPATKVVMDRQKVSAGGIKELKRTVWYQALVDMANLRTLGQIDRWKGAAIRETGTLLEIDRALTHTTRGAKAVKGLVDDIEVVANHLKPLDDAGRDRKSVV